MLVVGECHESFCNPAVMNCSLIDQTPTPTRFLRNCEESGLFQELEEAANPFDQDFASKAQSKPSETSGKLFRFLLRG